MTFVISAGSVLYFIIKLVISAYFYELHCYVSNKCTLCLVFDCYVSYKCTLYLYFIVTLMMSAGSVLYLIVTLVISTHYICTL